MADTFFSKLKKLFAKSFFNVGYEQIGGNYEGGVYGNNDYIDAYSASFLVHGCIDKIAGAVASQDFKLYKIKGRYGQEMEADEVMDSEVLDLLETPNPYYSGYDLRFATVVCLKLVGNAYWYKLRNKANQVEQLWLLRPDMVTAKMSKDGKVIEGFEYLVNGVKQFFKYEDIIHFKYYNPQDELKGLATIAPVMEVVKSAVFSVRWNKNFFYNSAMPDHLIVLKNSPNLSDAERQEIISKWNDKYKGTNNAHKVGLVEGDVDIKSLSLSAKDMDFVNMRMANRDDIFSAFGVPKPIMSVTDDVNRANAETAMWIFLSQTVEPEIRRIIEKINNRLIYPDFDETLFLDYDDPTPENREAILKEYESGLQNGWMTINEVRERENLPLVEGGDEILIPFSVVPLSDAGEKEESAEGEKRLRLKIDKAGWEKKQNQKIVKRFLQGKRRYKTIQKLTRGVIDNIKKKAESRRPFSKDQKDKWWFEFEKGLTSDTRLFKILVKKLFQKQEDRIRGQMRLVEKGLKGKKKKVEIEIDVNWDIEKEIFKQTSLPFYKDIILRNGKRASQLVGGEFKLTPAINRFIDSKALKFANEVNDTTADKIKNIIKEGINDGEGIDTISEKLNDIFDNKARVETIARTETAMAINESHNEAWKQSGVVDYKEWVATRDERTRESHAEMDGEVIKLNERYSNGLRFPSDPAGDPEEVINCRCTEIANFDNV